MTHLFYSFMEVATEEGVGGMMRRITCRDSSSTVLELLPDEDAQVIGRSQHVWHISTNAASYKNYSPTLILPALAVLDELVEEPDHRQMRVNVDPFVDSMVVEHLRHRRRREAVNVR